MSTCEQVVRPSLTLQDWGHIANIIAATAAAATAIVAVVAVLFARTQLKHLKAANRQTARLANNSNLVATYRSLLEKALEYPQFIAPNSALINLKHQTFDGDENEFRRYEAFVDLMLTTFDGMAESGDQAIDHYVSQWLQEHHVYLTSSYFKNNFQNQLGPAVSKLIEGLPDREHRRSRKTETKA